MEKNTVNVDELTKYLLDASLEIDAIVDRVHASMPTGCQVQVLTDEECGMVAWPTGSYVGFRLIVDLSKVSVA